MKKNSCLIPETDFGMWASRLLDRAVNPENVKDWEWVVPEAFSRMPFPNDGNHMQADTAA